MPLQCRNISDIYEPQDVVTTLNKVINMFQELSAKLDENSTQIRVIEAKLDKNNLQVSQLGSQLNGVVKQIQALSNKQDGEGSALAASCENVVSQKTPVISISQRKQPHEQEIKQLVQQYTTTRDWATLRTGLEAVLDKGEAYDQLQSIGCDYSSPLYRVCQSGYTQLALLLLCAGLPVNMVDSNGNTMLLGAARGGHLQLVILLLGRRADINMRGHNKWTPLISAAYSGHVAVVQYLVATGADTTARDTMGATALFYAKSRCYTTMADYLEGFPH